MFGVPCRTYSFSRSYRRCCFLFAADHHQYSCYYHRPRTCHLEEEKRRDVLLNLSLYHGDCCSWWFVFLWSCMRNIFDVFPFKITCLPRLFVHLWDASRRTDQKLNVKTVCTLPRSKFYGKNGSVRINRRNTNHIIPWKTKETYSGRRKNKPFTTTPIKVKIRWFRFHFGGTTKIPQNWYREEKSIAHIR